MIHERWSIAACALGLLLPVGSLDSSVSASDFESSWRLDHDRIWVGSDYHANRWQDWRVDGGRLECTEVGKRLPMRTVQVLTDTLAPQHGSIRLKVALGEIDPSNTFAENSRGGVIIGCGGPDIDYRLSALVHHQPAKDGGIVVLVDEYGAVSIRSNEQPIKSQSTWSISGDVTDADLPLLSAENAPDDRESDSLIGPDGYELQVDITSEGEFFQVEARVFDSEGTRVISNATASKLKQSLVEGGFGLVSNHGPTDSRNGWWFRGLSVTGPGVVAHAQREFGPILGTLYTLDDHMVKLTAQFPPLGIDDEWNATLQIQPEPRADWKTLQRSPIDSDSRTAHFRIEDWTFDNPVPYRVVYTLSRRDNTQIADEFHGIIRSQPAPDDPLLIASLSCHKTFTGGLAWNSTGLWFPHTDMVRALLDRDPDLVFFAGDQIYEGDLTPAGQRSEDAFILDYLWKYTHWFWAFNDLMRDRPTVVIPDDHDVYHGNIWGAGGRRAIRTDEFSAQDSGGYKRPPRFVNAVHRTQVAHLPDAHSEQPIGEGYSVYHTSFDLGGVSFAVLADRQFKESPSVAVPDGAVRNGWFTAEDFDVFTESDPGGIPLLGADQESFLEQWVSDWSPNTWMKVLLSQTPFACVQTLPAGATGGVQPRLTVFPVGGYSENDVPCADSDSNGWPMSARDRALEIIRPVQPLHLCGDQHLAFVAQYGVDTQRDGGVVFCSPAIANTWPRRWMPRDQSGEPRPLGAHRDGFGNMIAVDAVANPYQTGIPPVALNDRCPGYGLVRIDPPAGTMTLEAWPRASARDPGLGQFAGWPRTYATHALLESAWGYVLPNPELPLSSLKKGVLVRIEHADSGQLVRLMRLGTQTVGTPWRVPADGIYLVQLSEPTGEPISSFSVSARPVEDN